MCDLLPGGNYSADGRPVLGFWQGKYCVSKFKVFPNLYSYGASGMCRADVLPVEVARGATAATFSSWWQASLMMDSGVTAHLPHET